jgi:DNA-binding transcriptional LysR family regulator
MNLRQFDLNLLVALDALLTDVNVTHAGMRLNLSQSAMSGALARLREFFQDDLLVPAGRRMALTPLAEDLAGPVRDVLLQVQGTIATKPRFDPRRSQRRFAVAVSDYALSVFMIDLLRRVKRLAPAITFDLRPIGRRATEDFERGALDFLIAPEYYAGVHPSQPLFDDDFYCIAWTKNRQLGMSITLEQYLRSGHVVIQVSEGGFIHDERELRRLNFKRTIEVVTSTFDLAPQLVVGTDRIATVPGRLAHKYARFLPIRSLALPFEMSPIRETLQWHRARNDDPAHLWLRRQFKDAAARLAHRRQSVTPAVRAFAR